MGNRITRVSLVAQIGGYVSDVRKGKQETGELRREAERFSKGRYDAKVGADTKQARTELSALEKRLQAFGKTPVDQRVNLDTDEARDRLTHLQARMTEFATSVSDARVDLDDAAAQAKISRIEASLLRLGRATADPDIDLGGIAAAEADLATLTAQLQAFDGNDYRAQVHVNGTLAATRQASMLVDMLAMLGPTTVPLIASTVPALAGLTGGLAAAATGAGVTALAFSGVGDALDAMNDRQLAAGENASASAAAQVAASQQIADARRGVAEAQRAAVEAEVAAAQRVADARRSVVDAERDAARAARDAAEQVADARRGVAEAERAAEQTAVASARRIEDAQERVADARRNAAQVAVDANARVEAAEERLADSHRRVDDALADLHEARQQAIRDLDELRERTQDNALSIEGAEIGLLRARERLAEVSADAESTELDLREARLRVAEAEDRLADTRQQAITDQERLAAAEQAGIDGAERVIDARDRVREANEGVSTAEGQLAKAQRDAARAQADAAKDVQDALESLAETREDARLRSRQASQEIADAERRLARTTRDAAETRADAARSVADAERDLARAQQQAAQSRADAARRIEDAQRTLSRAMSSASTAMGEQSTEAEKLREKMDTLGPAGRDFVRYLQSIRPVLQRLQDTAQAGMFPGMQDGLESLMTLLPRAERLVGNVATAIGVLSREGGEALTDPFWREFFDYISNEADDIILDFGRSIGNVTKGFSGMLMALDPLADDFREAFLGMSEDYATWGTTLAKSEGYKDFVAYVRRVSPEVWDTLGQVASTMLAIAEAAAPVGEASLPIIRGLARVLEVIADSPAGPVLIGVAAGMAAINRTIRVYDAAKHSRLVGLVGGMGNRAETSQGKLGRFGTFLGGPWGVAIGLGVTALAGWITAQEDAEARVRDHADALDEQTGALTKANAEIVIATAREQGLYKAATEAGIGIGLLTKALLGDADAQAKVNGKLDVYLTQLPEVNQGAGVAAQKHTNMRATVDKLRGALEGNNRELQEARGEYDLNKRAMNAADEVLGNLNGTTNRNSLAQRAMAGDTSLTRRELLQLADQMGLNRQETQRLIEKYNQVPKNVDTDARFKDGDARRKTREFKRFVKDQLRDIKDEEVTVGLFVREFGAKGAKQIKLKGDSYNFGGGGPLPTHASSAPKALRGAVGGPAVLPKAVGDKASAAAATDAVSGRVRDLAERLQGVFDKMTAAMGPAGKPGRVLPVGTYSVGMPYLGYPGHYGSDYPASTGTPVYSPWPGRVTTSTDLHGSNPYNSTPYRSYGRYIRVDYANGESGLFAHLSQRGVGVGTTVQAGQPIGAVGTTGNSTGPHLHYEHRRNGQTINPASLGLFDKGGEWKSGTGGVNLSGKSELVLTNSVAKALFPKFDRSGGRTDLTPDYSTWARVVAAGASGSQQPPTVTTHVDTSDLLAEMQHQSARLASIEATVANLPRENRDLARTGRGRG